MYFSVKTSTKILGKVYIPCVCYSAPDFLVPTIEKMVKEGNAYVYDRKVAFQNGKVIAKKEVKPELKKEEKKKASKKEKTVEVANTEELAEEAGIIPPAEDEGF